MHMNYNLLKKILIYILTGVLIFMLTMNAGVVADDTEEYLYNGNIYYQINEYGNVVITRSRASVTEADIPSEIDGRIVTEIKGSAFRDRTRLIKVIIPDTIKTIGDYAFHQCIRLETVEIPDSVEYIGWNILESTPWLESQPEGCVIAGDNILIAYTGSETNVVIPYGVKIIAGCAFEGCTSMMSVEIPETVREIGGLAFSGCTQLTECNIPYGTETIGSYAFHWCAALQKVDIADSVTTIGNHAFAGCSSLISIKLPMGLQRIETAAFYECSSLTTINIPGSVSEISSQAFYRCVSLSEVTLNSTVTSVGTDAFSGCSGMQRIVFFNSDCFIADSGATVDPNAVIYGLRESTAQRYAQSYSRQFVLAVPMAGDLNEDGTIDLDDAVIILGIYANSASNVAYEISDFELIAGDLDVNGSIGIDDATEVLRIYSQSAVNQ